jgi:HEAT repeat protein
MLPAMVERLDREEDVGLQMALASALGRLGATRATSRLLALLRGSDTPDARREFALAIARLVGEEHHFIQLQRRAQTEPGTAFSQEVTALRERLAKGEQAKEGGGELDAALEAAAEALAREDLELGLALLAGALRLATKDALVGPCRTVVGECAGQIEAQGSGRIEYAVLALHAAECGLPEEEGGLF